MSISSQHIMGPQYASVLFSSSLAPFLLRLSLTTTSRRLIKIYKTTPGLKSTELHCEETEAKKGGVGRDEAQQGRSLLGV